jgi:hypothetical protein
LVEGEFGGVKCSDSWGIVRIDAIYDVELLGDVRTGQGVVLPRSMPELHRIYNRVKAGGQKVRFRKWSFLKVFHSR